MKKFIYLVTGLIVAMSLFSACNDTLFLTEEPKTIFTKENAFEKPAQIDAALVRAYNKFQRMYTINNSYAGGGDAATNLLKGDGSDVLGGVRGNGAANSFSNYQQLQTNNGQFLNLWNSMYQLIAYANLVFDGLDVIEDISQAEATYLAAQAYFFKGWAYLRLGECFGGVPFQDRLSEELKFDYTRDTRAQTYEHAIEYLKEAVNGLPDYPKTAGRLAKGMANHILAEAYLAIGVETGDSKYYKLAEDAATWTIQHHPLMTERFGSRSLNGTQPAGIPDNGVPRYNPDGNVFYDLFQIGNVAYGANGNTESLMVFVQPLYDEINNFGGNLAPWGITAGPNYRDAAWTPAMRKQFLDMLGGDEEKAKLISDGPWIGKFDNNIFPGGITGIHLTGSWGIIASMDYPDEVVWEGEFADDIRNSQVVLWTPVVMDPNNPMYLQPVDKEMILDHGYHARSSCKYTMKDLWGWDLDHCRSMGMTYVNMYGRDFYIGRSSETYLLRAEAKLRQNNKAGAAEDINVVRSRAKASKLFSAGEVDLFTILDERARELTWEEHRWPTLLRMGKGGQDTPGENPVMKEQLSQHNFTADILPDLYKGKAFPEWSLFPIPFNVISLNSEAELTQNHGWK